MDNVQQSVLEHFEPLDFGYGGHGGGHAVVGCHVQHKVAGVTPQSVVDLFPYVFVSFRKQIIEDICCIQTIDSSI